MLKYTALLLAGLPLGASVPAFRRRDWRERISPDSPDAAASELVDEPFRRYSPPSVVGDDVSPRVDPVIPIEGAEETINAELSDYDEGQLTHPNLDASTALWGVRAPRRITGHNTYERADPERTHRGLATDRFESPRHDIPIRNSDRYDSDSDSGQHEITIWDHRVRSVQDGSRFFDLPHTPSPAAATPIPFDAVGNYHPAFQICHRPGCMSPLHLENLRGGPQFPALQSDFSSPTRAQQSHLDVNKAINELIELCQELDDYFQKSGFYESKFSKWAPLRRREFLSAVDTVYRINKLRDDKITTSPDMTFNAIAVEVMILYTPIYHLSSMLDFVCRSSTVCRSSMTDPPFLVPFQPAEFYLHPIWLRKRLPDVLVKKILSYTGFELGRVQRTQRALENALKIINTASSWHPSYALRKYILRSHRRPYFGGRDGRFDFQKCRWHYRYVCFRPLFFLLRVGCVLGTFYLFIWLLWFGLDASFDERESTKGDDDGASKDRRSISHVPFV